MKNISNLVRFFSLGKRAKEIGARCLNYDIKYYRYAMVW